MKLIIRIEDGIDPGRALQAIAATIASGRISTSGGIKKFCHLSRYGDFRNEVEVFCKDRRTNNSADSFVIRKWKH